MFQNNSQRSDLLKITETFQSIPSICSGIVQTISLSAHEFKSFRSKGKKEKSKRRKCRSEYNARQNCIKCESIDAHSSETRCDSSSSKTRCDLLPNDDKITFSVSLTFTILPCSMYHPMILLLADYSQWPMIFHLAEANNSKLFHSIMCIRRLHWWVHSLGAIEWTPFGIWQYTESHGHGSRSLIHAARYRQRYHYMRTTCHWRFRHTHTCAEQLSN